MAHKKPASYDVDDWRTFMKRMYKEWDADPGYYALQHTSMSEDQRRRLAVAWCAYYNLGIAADASELRGRKFWDYLEKIYSTAKRASERRHFRGNAGILALSSWREKWPMPEDMALHMVNHPIRKLDHGVPTYFSIRKAGQQVYLYGDYFYWKWCDLHEVLGFGPVDMRNSEKHTPKLPQQGAQLIHMIEFDAGNVDLDINPAFAEVEREAVLKESYAMIVAEGCRLKVPPRTTDRRKFSLQEAETVCCVYKQMTNGSYTYGTRTAKAVNRLEAAKSKTARAMRATLLDLSPYSREELAAALASLKE